ncbi:unnamed protein product [Amoebophrya sp. A120]|nr:unnamed protein product [Amoebophrya sp. A120]|eukprot:GSA120T00018289001.1
MNYEADVVSLSLSPLACTSIPVTIFDSIGISFGLIFYPTSGVIAVSRVSFSLDAIMTKTKIKGEKVADFGLSGVRGPAQAKAESRQFSSNQAHNYVAQYESPSSSTPSTGPRDEHLTFVAVYCFDPSTLPNWPFERQRPLPLVPGQVVKVLYDDGSDWLLGNLLQSPARKGYFPRNYVVTVEEYRAVMEEFISSGDEDISDRRSTTLKR